MSDAKPPAAEVTAPAGIQEMAGAFQRCRVLLTAYELELFSALGDEGRSSAEVARSLGTAERATDRLMNALCAIGLLRKEAGRFSNTPATSQFLVKGKPGFMAGLMHTAHLWDSWSTLTEAVRQGKAVQRREIDDRGEGWLTAFIAAMHERARRHGPIVAGLLDLSRVSRILDVGGGSGAYSMAFARSREGIRVTVFDLPDVLPLTMSYIAEEGLGDRVETRAGNYHTDSLGGGYDLVFLSAIAHSNSFEENRKLIAKCAEALNPGGQVVVQEFIVDEDRTGPPFAALFALNMLVGTEAGDTFTESEVAGWMTDAGLSGIRRKDTDFGTTLIVGNLDGRGTG